MIAATRLSQSKHLGSGSVAGSLPPCYAAGRKKVFFQIEGSVAGQWTGDGRPVGRPQCGGPWGRYNATMNRKTKHSTRGPAKQAGKPRSGSKAGRAGSKAGRSGSKTGRAKSTKLRIIGGDMRGRPIEYHGADFTRPMKDNIRENLFNILGRAVRGAVCFDLFAGTGALAFESLSRGAQSAVVIEQNRQAIEVIRKTTALLNLEDRMQILTGDAFKICSQLLVPKENDTPWIVFVSPPYVLWEESLEPLNAIIQSVLDHAPPGSVLMAETEKKFAADKLPEGDWDLREYGATRLAFIEPAMSCGLEMGIETCDSDNGSESGSGAPQ